MPLQPNALERDLVARGVVPWPMLDGLLPIYQCAAIATAAELGVFAALEAGPRSAAELAEEVGASPIGVEVLLGALAGLGYVTERDGRHTLTAAAVRAVPSRQMDAMAPFLWLQIRTIGEAVRAVREAPAHGIGDRAVLTDPRVSRAFQTAMRRIASGNVAEVSRRLALPDGAARLLDVGGSHALHTVALCRKYPELRGTVFDLPPGIANARRTLQEQPDVADRIDLVEGDFQEGELPGGYDVVFLGNIVHGQSPEGNRALLARIASATTADGMVVILDQLAGASGSRFARSVAGLLGFNLFLATGGRAYRFEDMAGWLVDSGFSEVERCSLRRAPGMSLITGRKS